MGGACSNPRNAPAKNVNTAAGKPAADADVWEGVKSELLTMMNSDPQYDDGSYGPIFIRLAWHSAGTYDAESGTGGTANGATMRFSPEKDDPENTGLDVAMKLLEPVKEKFPSISFADLWVFAAYVFIEQSGGPSIEFVPGRVDGTENDAVENGRLPEAEYGVENTEVDEVDEQGRIKGWEKTAQHVKDVFLRMGLNLQEATALLCGGHVYGRCHADRTGYVGPWVEKPTEFSNEYAADMIEDEWKLVTEHSEVKGCPVHQSVRPAHGKKQYVRVVPDEDESGSGSEAEGDGQQMMLVTDMVLLWDEEFKVHLEKYAEDEELLKKDFGLAFKKLTELGFVQ